MKRKTGSLLGLAESDAASVQNEYPRLFLVLPIKVSQVMRAMRVPVSTDTTLRQEAVVERYHVSPQSDCYRVRIKPNLPANRGRLLLAHELGHIVLNTRRKEECERWNRATRERFANVFARELLIPMAKRGHMAAEFRGLRKPRDLIRTSDAWGVLPTSLIKFASSHPEWTAGSDMLWLVVKHSVNIYSGLDSRLRVVAAAFDRRRWYLPTNQSLSQICNAEELLTMVQPGREVTKRNIEINISEVAPERNPKYRKTKVVADFWAIRLQESGSGGRGFFLLGFIPGVAGT